MYRIERLKWELHEWADTHAKAEAKVKDLTERERKNVATQNLSRKQRYQATLYRVVKETP